MHTNPVEYEIGITYTFEEDSPQGWSAWTFYGCYWVKVAGP